MSKPLKQCTERKRTVQINGDKLRRLRQEAGLTQAQLARKSGLDEKTIYNAEKSPRDNVRHEVQTVRDLAEVFGLEAGDIMMPEAGGVDPLYAHQAAGGNVVCAPKTTPLKSLQDTKQARKAMAADDRAETLRNKAKAHADDMWNLGLHDGLNCSVEAIDYGLLQKIEERTRIHRENADPENVITTFDQVNAAANSPFQLNYPGNWEYKLGFIEALLTLRDIGGSAPAAQPAAAAPARKSMF
ncbi:helix-turn-helix transcriptional regulator [Limimaricola litoreus]|uniref:Helix-turn-helix domain-containing protein n=1 Tax=Limimaricola litoreus TaxID=2955316 RepID=A0A9X2FPE0_9RHOB|nr:helix-turn-helix transcriptional regulator [Limimaricola litoreus]MCP1168911.1 helix-turn-helix domain-containing protein [Limimaricola litoreus]